MKILSFLHRLPSFVSIALLAMSGIASVHAEMREFKSAQGSVIRAQLKKAKGQMILLTKEDGKEVQVSLANFSKEDQTYILRWMAEDPTALDYNFVVKTEEKILPATKKAMNGYSERIATVDKNYNISILNSCRNSIDDVEVEWCCFMLDRVTLSSYGSYSSSSGLMGELRVKKGTETFSKMGASHSVQFTTAPFAIDSSIDKYSTGGKLKDRLQGVWLRFYRGDALISEWKSPDCPKTEWPGGVRKSKPKADTLASNNISSKPNKIEPIEAPVPATPTPEPEKPKSADDELGEIIKIFQLEDPK